MITCPSCGHRFDPVFTCPIPWCGNYEPHRHSSWHCRPGFLRDRVPRDWPGTLHIHLGGKAGELLYLSGCFPAVREIVPKAKLILHVHPHYESIVSGLKYKPDEVVCDDWYVKFPLAPLADQVTHGLKWAHASYGYRNLTLTDELTMHTGCYMKHQGGIPFYRLFMENLGVGDREYMRPDWGWDTTEIHHTVVLASANIHNGSHLRQIPGISPGQWEELAALAQGNGHPIATGHKDDPQPEMPGWTWLDTNDPAEVFHLLARSSRVVGFNSGMTFAAMLLSPGRVTMIDTQQKKQYLIGPMKVEGIVADQHRQIPLGEVESQGWYETIKEAIT